ncbi:CBO0543 family protein [Cohnella caldifontis]|uniref:CBO0543 family protein n=1 Tax=Cohnella caldifontis TaxID=3027471 RepID=UPI0023EA7F00|nr:CBO0543 family protein [Cohnella sp. YIM B05605]
MVILIFSLGALAAFLITKSYKYMDPYYPTVLYVVLVSLLYPVICRGYMVWHYPSWGWFTDKVNGLVQSAVYFPCTTVLFLRYFPRRTGSRIAYLAAFVAAYAIMEGLLLYWKQIIYEHGWNFGWSVFIDVCMFSMIWLHSRSWKAAWAVSLCILILLLALFRVPYYA